MNKPRGASAVMAQRRAVTEADLATDPRADLDFLPTPPWGTRAMLKHVLKLDREDGQSLSCWEPCCGEGHMAEPLKEVFGKVYTSDVYPHGYGDVGSFVGVNGLDLGDVARCPFRPDWIITNPPFKLAYEVAVRSLSEARRGVALLLRLQWLETEERYNLFRQFNPSCMAVYVERLAMMQYGWDPEASTATAYAWFVWSVPTPSARLEEGPIFPVRFIPPGCKHLLTIPSDYRFAKSKASLTGVQP